jgi:hypothetical protein
MALVSLRENTYSQRLKTKNWLHGFGKFKRKHTTQSEAENKNWLHGFGKFNRENT